MAGSLAQFFRGAGKGWIPDLTINTAILDRYVKQEQAVFTGKWHNYVDCFWEAGRNRGSDFAYYAGNGKTSYDAFSGAKFIGPQVNIVLSGDHYAMDVGGVHNQISYTTEHDICRPGEDFTVIVVSERTTLPGIANPIIGSNAGTGARFAMQCTAGGALEVDNGVDAAISVADAFAAARRDISWFAYREDTHAARAGRRSATVGVSVAAWTQGFDSSVTGEQLGSTHTTSEALNGKLLARFRCPFNMNADTATLQIMLDAIADHYDCAA